jgi:hypothetical protein
MTEFEDTQFWNKQYEKLVEFKRKNGHCFVPTRYQKDMSLAIWVTTQRGLLANNAIILDRQDLLDELGFVWKARVSKTDKKWHQQYEKLVEFQRNNGNCLVPQRNQGDVPFGKWVRYQRQRHCKNHLQLDRKELLDKIGFAWRVDKSILLRTDDDKSWHQQYKKLVEFQGKYGNCLAPQNYKEDVRFGKWVRYQRQRHSKNHLQLDRKELLDEIGFAWRVARHFPVRTDDKSWYKQYEKLGEFQRKHGHCIVPHNQEAASCAKWVCFQRHLHANNKIRVDRKELLDEIGFAWKARGAKNNKYARINPSGGVNGSSRPSSVEKDGGREEEDSKSSQAAVQGEATHHQLPFGWKHVKLEPDC